jgi:tetratricopeptide (TPR) repeat protein
MLREDYVMRLIRQIVELVARVAKLREAGEHDRALQEASRWYEDLLGMPPNLSDAVDAATLAELLKEPDTIRAAARLSWEEGKLYKAKGDPLTAFGRYRRALELYLEARALAPDDDDDSAILELSRVVAAEHLHPRYRTGTPSS